jgi:hypothetical protein
MPKLFSPVVPGSPLEWFSSIRSVIWRKRGSAILNSGRCWTTGSSRPTFPSSTSCIRAVATKTLLMDPMLNRVWGWTGRLFSRSAMPKPSA